VLKTLLRLTSSAIVLMMLIGGSATLSASSDDEDDDDDFRRFEIVARTVSKSDIDIGAPGLSQGDQLIIWKDMFFRREPNKRVGDDVIHCTVTRVVGPQKVATSCDVNYWFDGVGQITAQGLVHLDLVNPSQFDIAITGGTGRFRTATGFVTIRQTTGDHHLTFHVGR
jgi:hypothetical protein